MIGETTAIAACLAYIGSLFVLAWWVDRQGERGRGLPANAYIYSLSLCVYATAWTFYGSAGQAAQSGVVFLTPEVGATLAVLLWVVVLRKMVRAARRHHITSIADLAASRYGRSALVGAVLALVAVVGLVPYLALQLKAISASFLMLTGGHSSDQASVPILRDTGFYAAFLMAFFAILFGTRHLSPSERHDGLVAAVAAESLVKLAAFLAVGMFVTFSLYDGPGDLFAQAAAKLPQYRQLISIGGEFLPYGRWFGLIFLSVLAVILLPSQFHMAVIENRDEHHLDRAVWLFPLYLLAINLFVIPAAFAGLMRFSPGSVHPDTFVLALPMAFGPPWLALLVFIGGLSAAIAYAVVTTLTLSIMACNNLLLPALLRLGWIRTLSSRQGGRLVLYLRRCLTLLLLALAYAYLRLVGSLYGLVEIGLTSFVAVAQFAPAVLGGMFWRQGNRRGALAGLTLGFLGWGYTLLLPAFVNVGWLPTHLVREGAFGLAWLKPLALFGLEGMDRISHGLFWSLLANAVAYIGVSLARPPTPAEEKDAARFVDVLGADWPGEDVQDREASALELHGLLARFLGREYADTTLAGFARERGLADWRALGPDAELVGRVEKLLAGAVGAPSARILIDSVVKQAPVSSQEVMRIVEETSHAIAYSHQLEEQSRKLAALADALRESEGRLDAIIDNAPAAIFMKDTGGRYILINRLFEETFHVGREAARGKTDYDIFPAELADGFVRADRQVLAEGRSLQVEETAPGLEGVHTYLTVKFPLRDAHGRIYAVCGIATDITARKRAEEAMAEARARFFGILDIAIDAIISVN
ncbi:MAG: PAS domain-containing protein, partial [Actinomycetota bacterium]